MAKLLDDLAGPDGAAVNVAHVGGDAKALPGGMTYREDEVIAFVAGMLCPNGARPSGDTIPMGGDGERLEGERIAAADDAARVIPEAYRRFVRSVGPAG